MKKHIKQIQVWSCHSLPILLAFLLIVLLLKQLSLFSLLQGVYQALLPVFGGIVIAFLLQPIIDRMQRYVSYRSAVLLVYAGLLLFAILLCVIMIPILYEQFLEFFVLIPKWIEKVKALLAQYRISWDAVENYQSDMMQGGYSIVTASLADAVIQITKFGIAYMTAFFLSIDLHFFKKTCKKCLSSYHRFVTFYHTMSHIVYQYLIGTALDLLFVAVTSGVILYAVEFPNTLFYAIILALSNLFPYIGPLAGLLVVIGTGFLSYEQLPYFAFFLLWIVQQIEANIVQPLIFKQTMDVRPFLTFVTLFAAEALFGITGILLSPIFASIIQIGIRSYLHAKHHDVVGTWNDIWYDFDEVMKEEKTI